MKLKEIFQNSNNLKAFSFYKIGFVIGLFGILLPALTTGFYFNNWNVQNFLLIFMAFLIFSIILAIILENIGYIIGNAVDKAYKTDRENKDFWFYAIVILGATGLIFFIPIPLFPFGLIFIPVILYFVILILPLFAITTAIIYFVGERMSLAGFSFNIIFSVMKKMYLANLILLGYIFILLSRMSISIKECLPFNCWFNLKFIFLIFLYHSINFYLFSKIYKSFVSIVTKKIFYLYFWFFLISTFAIYFYYYIVFNGTLPSINMSFA